MHIEIRIERPLALLLVIGGVVFGLLTFMQSGKQASAAIGGTETAAPVAETEEQIRVLREEQEVLLHRESILREQLAALLAESEMSGGDTALQDEISELTTSLVALFQDRQATEAELLESFRQMWEAQGHASIASSKRKGTTPTMLAWPVEPALGVSAYFHDAGYKKRFGMQHEAIDIPVNQGSTIVAPADGTVTLVSDKGLGYSSLVIDHGGGVATLYGHVSQFLVSEGQSVSAGDAVALSGGRPGTKGAGMLTTGSHLHFEVHKDGHPVDPLGYLPAAD